MRELNVRRELLRAIILAALVGAAGGTVITLIGISIIKLSPALLIILPLAVPMAIITAAIPCAMILGIASILPNFVVRNRAVCALGVSVLVVLVSVWGSEERLFPFNLPYGSACVIIGTIVACWWCYHFTSHLTDQA